MPDEIIQQPNDFFGGGSKRKRQRNKRVRQTTVLNAKLLVVYLHMTPNQARQNGEAGVGLGIELCAILKFMGRLFIYPRGKGGKGVLLFFFSFCISGIRALFRVRCD